jgi:hypothetical protein
MISLKRALWVPHPHQSELYDDSEHRLTHVDGWEVYRCDWRGRLAEKYDMSAGFVYDGDMCIGEVFQGELVEADPSDEPAEELLKRILAEKAKLDGQGKKRRKRKVVD